MKHFLLFLLIIENLLLYGFRPWGQEKVGWTALTGGLMLFSVLLMFLLSVQEDRKEKEREKIRKKAGF
jgi:hypothetical protein